MAEFDFKKMLEDMQAQMDNPSSREVGRYKVGLMSEAFLDRMLKMTTIAANMERIEPGAGKVCLDMYAPYMNQWASDIEAEIDKFQKGFGEL